ncbi:MAG: sterol desaturase family protein [Woeseiaceae bacterium]|jgi:sterol desaturase/sphingolipid hydroxylase (fatty acid hydroxylase superfamily)|nr:sterol desaturase family protein [Woeseiaceae bacterium]|tara:strand:+ start:1644 stop:2891 length:1248 start_codon:yes stop_codon:yes gene_type:complete
MDKSSIITFAIPVFFLMILLELAYGFLIGKNTYRVNDTFTSISIGLISRLPVILNLGFQGVIFVYFAKRYSINLMPVNELMTWVIAFIMYDFFYYWMHRLHHEYRVLWATHVVHHHGEDYNLATALRQTSTGFLWKWIFFLPMIIVGVPGEVFVSVAGVNLVYQFWVHTRHVGHLGWIEKIFVTPMNHRVHHAKNKEYIDANYGGVFILWDRFFGTYIPERSDIKPVYGTVSQLNSWNPLWANFQVFYQMIQDTINTKNMSDKFKIWYSRTNWRPIDLVHLSSEYQITSFAKKYNPKIKSEVNYFTILQLIMLTIASSVILFTLELQDRSDTYVFAIILVMQATFTGMLLQGKSFSFKSFFVFSLFLLFSFSFIPIIDMNLLASKVFLIQCIINILLISVALMKEIGLRTSPIND